MRRGLRELGWFKRSAAAWNPAISSGDRSRRRLAARLAGFFEQLALSARPILEGISGSATALQIDLVGAQRNLLRCWLDPDCSRLFHRWRGTLPRLGHTLLLSTGASSLLFVESHCLRIHRRAHRKIQYIESMEQVPPMKVWAGAHLPRKRTPRREKSVRHENARTGSGTQEHCGARWI